MSKGVTKRGLVWARDELMAILTEGEMSDKTRDQLRPVAWEIDRILQEFPKQIEQFVKYSLVWGLWLEEKWR